MERNLVDHPLERFVLPTEIVPRKERRLHGCAVLERLAVDVGALRAKVRFSTFTAFPTARTKGRVDSN